MAIHSIKISKGKGLKAFLQVNSNEVEQVKHSFKAKGFTIERETIKKRGL